MISICSVNLGAYDYLNVNWEMTVQHSLVAVHWIVAENSAPKISAVATDQELRYGFDIITGVPEAECIRRAKELGVGPNNVQHGLSLNKTIAHAVRQYNDRYIVLLDPDFFIIPEIHRVIEMMEARRLTFFGAPYASKTPLIYDFPVAFCLFIDRQRLDVPVEDLDFEPANAAETDVYPDVGYKVYHKYLLDKSRYDIAIPSADEAPYKHTAQTFGINYPNERNDKGTKIDEYFWDSGKPFGLHTRGKLNQVRNRVASRIQSQIDIAKMVVSGTRWKS